MAQNRFVCLVYFLAGILTRGQRVQLAANFGIGDVGARTVVENPTSFERHAARLTSLPKFPGVALQKIGEAGKHTELQKRAFWDALQDTDAEKGKVRFYLELDESDDDAFVASPWADAFIDLFGSAHYQTAFQAMERVAPSPDQLPDLGIVEVLGDEVEAAESAARKKKTKTVWTIGAVIFTVLFVLFCCLPLAVISFVYFFNSIMRIAMP